LWAITAWFNVTPEIATDGEFAKTWNGAYPSPSDLRLCAHYWLVEEDGEIAVEVPPPSARWNPNASRGEVAVMTPPIPTSRQVEGDHLLRYAREAKWPIEPTLEKMEPTLKKIREAWIRTAQEDRLHVASGFQQSQSNFTPITRGFD
jgi:hypothetical protein